MVPDSNLVVRRGPISLGTYEYKLKTFQKIGWLALFKGPTLGQVNIHFVRWVLHSPRDSKVKVLVHYKNTFLVNFQPPPLCVWYIFTTYSQPFGFGPYGYKFQLVQEKKVRR